MSETPHAVATNNASAGDHPHRCGNCDAPLVGPYCASCGQHAHASARNLAAVMHDAWHDTTHVDGRLWHTLYLLLARPGQLTVDYFEDRRARYLPPVRLYLVLSVLFFGLGGLGSSVTNSHKARPNTAATTVTAPAASTAASSADDRDTDDDSDATTIIDDKDRSSWNLPCDQLPSSEGSIAIRGADNVCRHFNAQDPNEFIKTLLHNIPKMMFVFLPLLAAVMLLLYWRPRRFYVEHLVYLLHNHSALFAAFLLLKLVSWVTKLWHPLSVLAVLGGIGLFFYTLWYPYKSMRRYYRQGRLLTIGKYGLIACAYFFCLVLTLTGVAIFTALEG
jgi:hypothetical protein